MSSRLGYEDLLDAQYVFESLLGYGMFSDRMPSCFFSKCLLEYVENLENYKEHAAVIYMSSRNNGISRQLAIPHPESYFLLCQTIKDYWEEINEHLGQPEQKFNYCHVRKIKDKPHIFEMNYEGNDKYRREEIEQKYLFGCSMVAKTDISNCYPSIYTHSIPWAIQGKELAKQNRNTTDERRNTHWSNDLDREVRNCNDKQTKGILIGTHTSSIVSEIILTQIDKELYNKGFRRVIRHIDDYTYFATDENDAKRFVKELEIELRQYELQLNQKKTEIISLDDYFSYHWTHKLNQFVFPNNEILGFTIINSYLNYAISLVKENNDFALLNYAIKVISKKRLSNRSKRLYVTRILSIALTKPYLLPLLEKYVLHFLDSEKGYLQDLLKDFLEKLYKKAIEVASLDSLSFVFYFALKYKIHLDFKTHGWRKDIVQLNDCISMLLAWKYCKMQRLVTKEFDEKADELKLEERSYDQFWLFLYEHAKDARSIPNTQKFLRNLKRGRKSFLNFSK